MNEASENSPWGSLVAHSATPVQASATWKAFINTVRSTAFGVQTTLEPAWSQVDNSSLAIGCLAPVCHAAEKYAGLGKMLEHFASLDPDESWFIDEEACQLGKHLIDLAETYNVPPPLIFSHGGDAVVLAWDEKNTRRCLTAASHRVRLQTFDKANGVGGEVKEFDLTKKSDVFNLTRLIGGEAWKQVNSLSGLTPSARGLQKASSTLALL